MGLFTVYCCLCGGPADWIDPQRVIEDDTTGSFKFAGEFAWLIDCCAVTAINEVWFNNQGRGEIEYGVMETQYGNVAAM